MRVLLQRRFVLHVLRCEFDHRRWRGDPVVGKPGCVLRPPPAKTGFVQFGQDGLHLGRMVVGVDKAQPGPDQRDKPLFLCRGKITCVDAFRGNGCPEFAGTKQQVDGRVTAYGLSPLAGCQAVQQGLGGLDLVLDDEHLLATLFDMQRLPPCQHRQNGDIRAINRDIEAGVMAAKLEHPRLADRWRAKKSNIEFVDPVLSDGVVGGKGAFGCQLKLDVAHAALAQNLALQGVQQHLLRLGQGAKSQPAPGDHAFGKVRPVRPLRIFAECMGGSGFPLVGHGRQEGVCRCRDRGGLGVSCAIRKVVAQGQLDGGGVDAKGQSRDQARVEEETPDKTAHQQRRCRL